jgi:hypothetical protein
LCGPVGLPIRRGADVRAARHLAVRGDFAARIAGPSHLLRVRDHDLRERLPRAWVTLGRTSYDGARAFLLADRPGDRASWRQGGPTDRGSAGEEGKTAERPHAAGLGAGRPVDWRRRASCGESRHGRLPLLRPGPLLWAGQWHAGGGGWDGLGTLWRPRLPGRRGTRSGVRYPAWCRFEERGYGGRMAPMVPIARSGHPGRPAIRPTAGGEGRATSTGTDGDPRPVGSVIERRELDERTAHEVWDGLILTALCPNDHPNPWRMSCAPYAARLWARSGTASIRSPPRRLRLEVSGAPPRH